ncbi:hypothetical protein C0Q70_12739 [Pomacea canaliculata]|uniref:PHD-type domain-containing protein n=1 Tax=Pomacea canaliculata TaxID=400727 RepID=A0A2T7P2C3_POMCA|nr:hypothetical protein C0Q70_12739 [Pomacea canaliculata]
MQEEFSEDMVRIIQTALNDEDQLPTRRKHNNSVRSIFIKQMERCFPWFNVKTCRLWQHNKTLPKGMLPEAVLPPSDDHTYAQWLEREDNPPSLQPSSFRHVPTSPHAFAERDGSSQPGITGEDSRQCALCLTFGDDEMEGAGRLLYAGQDDWVHVNCALWSAEVFEEADGTLQNVHVAMVRGRQLRCESCKTPGATVGCCVRGCPANYHFVCARHSDCVFLEDKTVFCSEHKQHADCRIGRQRKFAVHRRTCIDMADIRCMKKSWARGLDAGFINVLFGACTVENLGFLAPLSDFIGCLLPLEFKSTRIYWSTVDARRRTVYTCRIVEVQPTLSTPEVTVQDMRIVHDEEHPDFVPFETLSLPISGIQAHLHSSSNSHWGLPSLLDNSQAEQTGKRDDQDVWCVEDEDVYNSTHNPEKPSNIATEDTGSPIPSVSCTNEQEICRKNCEFGDLTRMVERLNHAATRNRRSQSADQITLQHSVPRNSMLSSPLSSLSVASHQRRAMSCSPVSFSTSLQSCVALAVPSAAAIFSSAALVSTVSSVSSSAYASSDSRTLASLNGKWHQSTVRTVTPILEQLENELTECSPAQISSSRIGFHTSFSETDICKVARDSLDVGLCTTNMGPMCVSPSPNCVSLTGEEKRTAGDTESACGDSEHHVNAGDSDTALAEQILSSVPAEILEDGHVKVVVVPGTVSPEEAVQLAEAALQETNHDVGEDPFIGGTDNLKTGLVEADVCDHCRPGPPGDTDTVLDKKFDDTALGTKSADKHNACDPDLLAFNQNAINSKQIKQELLTVQNNRHDGKLQQGGHHVALTECCHGPECTKYTVGGIP